MSVRRVRADEWKAFRAIRLRALGDSPSAFAARLEEETALPDGDWRADVAEYAKSDEAAAFVAEEDGVLVGLAGGFVEDGGDVRLVAMWVEPERRRSGVGRALTEAVVEWARARGAAVALWVNERNAPAVALYHRLGFVPTGERQPLRSDPAASGIRMRRAL